MHLDILGKEILMGSMVIYSEFNSLVVGFVEKITPKQIKVRGLDTKKIKYKYPTDVHVVEDKQASIFLLKRTT